MPGQNYCNGNDRYKCLYSTNANGAGSKLNTCSHGCYYGTNTGSSSSGTQTWTGKDIWDARNTDWQLTILDGTRVLMENGPTGGILSTTRD